ncbi:hypothetical protein BKA66DRAFT_468881 [Pyrenochaeta sp. MPI-SDFR-AT-0127]|nr:hypothetical protein BKA66DRAFT_468881 [Pyrenochaeta sp. MPI-SDFR-AT-0127]
MSRPADTRKPHRRTHKKSRYGCSECRRRRVKCDERQPLCTGCIERDSACQYPRRAESRGSSSGSQLKDPSVVEVNTETGLVGAPEAPCSVNYPTFGTSAWRSIGSRELELMHFWCTRTCNSFTPHLTEFFRDHVGKEALRYDYLMNSLLALTSYHIASETGNAVDARSYSSAGLQYHNQALSGLREVLLNITPSTCVAIFACSANISICAVVSPLLHTGSDDEAKSITQAVLPVIDILKGTSSIIDVSHPWLLQGPLSGMMRGSMSRQPSAIKESFPANELRRLNDALFSSRSCAQDKLNNETDKHQIFEDAVQKLEQAAKNGISMLPWLLKIDSRFMDELRKEELMAVAIFMHWSVLLDQLDEKWWAKYSGKRIVKKLSAILHGHGRDWEQINKWCRAQVGLCPLIVSEA